MITKKVQYAILRLDQVSTNDPEAAHGEADEIILDLVPPEVRAAYERLVKRCLWWAAS